VNAQQWDWAYAVTKDSLQNTLCILQKTLIDGSGNIYTNNYGDVVFSLPNGDKKIKRNRVAKLSPNGDFMQEFGNFQWLSNYIVDKNENVYMVGRDTLLSSEYFSVCKYDSNGNLIWRTDIGQKIYGAVIETICLVSDGILLGGDWTYYAGQWAGYYKPFIAKYSFNGKLIFCYKYESSNGSNDGERIAKIIADKNDAFYVIGHLTFLSHSLTFTDSIKQIAISNASSDEFLVKYNNLGIIDWVKVLNEPVIMCSAELERDTLYFGAYKTIPSYEVDISKFDSSGTFLNTIKLFNAGNGSQIAGIRFDSLHNMYACGFFRDSLIIGNKFFPSQGYGVANWFMIKQDIDANNNFWHIVPFNGSCWGNFDLNQQGEIGLGFNYTDTVVFANSVFTPGAFDYRGAVISKLSGNLNSNTNEFQIPLQTPHKYMM